MHSTCPRGGAMGFLTSCGRPVPACFIPVGTSGRCTARRVQLTATAAPVDVSSDVMELGKSGLKVSSLGVGAWSWGDRTGYWGYNSYGNYGADDNRTAFEALANAGVDFIDTAEVYGFGKSEELIASFKTNTVNQPTIATKFAPLPWRFTADAVPAALQASLDRLQQRSVGLYMIHWPAFLINGFCNDAFVAGLAKCKEAGLTQAVGVSNFKEERIRKAHTILQDKGVPLASNQIQYSLLYRKPEQNGMLQACKELGVTPIAYSPLCQGLLTGKYTPGVKPGGPRAAFYTEDKIRMIMPLLGLMRDIGEAHGGKTPAQVAINWTMCKGCLPIPGAKNAKQATEVAGALGWRLTPDEVAALDAESSKLNVGTGAPFETW